MHKQIDHLTPRHRLALRFLVLGGFFGFFAPPVGWCGRGEVEDSNLPQPTLPDQGVGGQGSRQLYLCVAVNAVINLSTPKEHHETDE